MTKSLDKVLLGMGNPLLDLCAEVSVDYLSEWGLEPNNAILAEEKHQRLYQEMVEKFKVDFLAGITRILIYNNFNAI